MFRPIETFSCRDLSGQPSQDIATTSPYDCEPAMASDEIVWSIINQQFCSFKLKLPGNASQHQKSTKSNFCRNEHNVTGLCNR